MAFWDKLVGEFVDIIEWTDESNDSLVWRFERYQNEIKHGAKLTVRQQQAAVFVNEGQIADVFTPGMYELTTANLPILSTLKGWKHGFNSPFKAEVYFVNLRTFTDNKWGTKNPIMLRDPEFGPIRLRAFGNFSIKVSNSRQFIEEIVGTDGHFTLEEIHGQLRTLAVSKFTDALAESKIPALDLAANYDEFSKVMSERITPDFEAFGLALQSFLIENISLPPEVEAVLDKRTSMGIMGDLNRYSQFQAANAMEQAAKNPSGDASAGVGMGMGFAMANQMANMMNQPSQLSQPQAQGQPSSTSTPPPIPTQKKYFVAVDGQQTGPYTLDELKSQAAANALQRTSLVWSEGMSAWAEANTVDDLKPLFAAMPPPIPGA